MGMTPTRYWRLEYIEGTSSKYYEVFITSNGVLALAWGRIGTEGQCKIQKFVGYAEAEVVGMRQAYAKEAKGYRRVHDDVSFMVEDFQVDTVIRSNSIVPFRTAMVVAETQTDIYNPKDAAYRHYDDFTAKAERLIERARTDNVEELLDDFQTLEAAWRELKERHDRTEITVGLCRQMLMQALTGSKEQV